MNFGNLLAIRMKLQAGARAGCDLCLAISPIGCPGLGCGSSLLERSRFPDALSERDYVRPFTHRESSLPNGGVTTDFVDKPKQTSILQNRKSVSCGHH